MPRRCSKCGGYGPFYRSSAKDTVCAECRRTWQREYSRRNADSIRDKNLRRKYGITLAERNAMLVAQGGHCAICPATEPGGRGEFHVDHDHNTGRVRGLLCHSCNTAIGLLGEDPKRLGAVLEYLKRSQ